MISSYLIPAHIQGQNRAVNGSVCGVLVATLLFSANVSAQDAAPTPLISTEAATTTSLNSIDFALSFDNPIDISSLEASDIQISVGNLKNLSQGYEMVESVDNGRLSNDQGVFRDKDNRLYQAKTKSHVVSISGGGNSLTLGTGEAGAGSNQFNYPSGVTVDSQGTIYVADTGNHRIQIFNNAGVYQKTIGAGEAGSDDQHFDEPYGVAVDSFGNVYVADTSNHRIQVFNDAGEYQKTIGGANDFKYPQNIEVDVSGKIYVMDTGNNRVVTLDRGFVFNFEVDGLAVGDTLSINIPEGAIKSPAGGASHASNIVKINIAAELVVMSATTNQEGDSILIDMSEAVTMLGQPTANDFTVHTTTRPIVTNVRVDANNHKMVALSLNSPIPMGVPIMLNYERNEIDINSASTPNMRLANFAAQEVDNAANEKAKTKKLNEAIVPHISQTIIASSMSAIEGRMDAARSSNREKAGYSIAMPQELQNIYSVGYKVLNQEDNAESTDLLETVALDVVNGSSMQTIEKSFTKIKDGDINWENALFDSSFVFPFQALGGNSQGINKLAFWGSGEYKSLDGDSNNVDWDGDVKVYQIGIESRLGSDKIIGGLISRGEGDFDYSQQFGGSGNSTEKGEYRMRLDTYSPYMGISLTDKTSTWGLLGYGKGDLEIQLDDNTIKRTSDVNMLSFGVGLKTDILSDVSKVVLKSDVTLAKVEIEGNNDDNIDKQTISSQRLRVLLNWSREKLLSDERTITPSMEAGIRFDGGAGQNNAGLDISTGLHYANHNSNFVAEGKLHAFEGSDLNEFGFSGSIGIEPDNGYGTGLKLHHGYGNTASNVQKIWNHGVPTSSSIQSRSPWTDIRLSYGMPRYALRKAGLLTPYTGMTFGKGSETYRAGLDFNSSQKDMKLNLEYEQKEHTSSDSSILFNIGMQF